MLSFEGSPLGAIAYVDAGLPRSSYFECAPTERDNSIGKMG
jgi:hypothetical protein